MAKVKKAQPRWRFRRQSGSAIDKLPSIWNLLGGAYRTLIDNWKIFGAVSLIYAGLYVLLVRSGTAVNVSESRELVGELLGSEASGAIETFTVAGAVLASASQSGEAGQSLYGTLLVIVFSLVQIWMLRRLAAGKKFKLRDAFYRSQTALIPFILLLLLITIQLLPFVLGGMLYATVQAQNIVVNAWEGALFAAIWLGLSALSGWWLANSLMAAYAVTLPGMYPLAALKATAKSIKHKRWAVLGRVLFLLAAVGALFLLMLLFTVSVVPGLNLWPIDLFGVVILPFVHAYLYQLYRSLI